MRLEVNGLSLYSRDQQVKSRVHFPSSCDQQVKSRVRFPSTLFSYSYSVHVVHTHVPASVTQQYSLAMLYGWEGTRRCGFALVMCLKLNGITTYRFSDLRKGDEYLAICI